MELTNFSIFKNTNKKEGSNQPDYTISAKIGDDYVSIGGGWIKDLKSGGKYISCKVSPPKEKEVSPATVSVQMNPDVPVTGPDGLEIPF
jgi:uncharacterized protein (DUF736 family)